MSASAVQQHITPDPTLSDHHRGSSPHVEIKIDEQNFDSWHNFSGQKSMQFCSKPKRSHRFRIFFSKFRLKFVFDQNFDLVLG